MTVGPLEQNIFPGGAVVAGMQRYFLATADRLDWSPTCAFHQAKGSQLEQIVGKDSSASTLSLLETVALPEWADDLFFAVVICWSNPHRLLLFCFDGGGR